MAEHEVVVTIALPRRATTAELEALRRAAVRVLPDAGPVVVASASSAPLATGVPPAG